MQTSSVMTGNCLMCSCSVTFLKYTHISLVNPIITPNVGFLIELRVQKVNYTGYHLSFHPCLNFRDVLYITGHKEIGALYIISSYFREEFVETFRRCQAIQSTRR